MKSFSIIQMLVVIGIGGLLFFLIIPTGVDFYESLELDSNRRAVVQTLRRAQLKAMSQEADSSFGVYFTSSHYTLFKGDSFISHDPSGDEVFSLAPGVNASGLGEIVFSKLDGEPNVAGNVELRSGGKVSIINISQTGVISAQ